MSSDLVTQIQQQLYNILPYCPDMYWYIPAPPKRVNTVSIPPITIETTITKPQ